MVVDYLKKVTLELEAGTGPEDMDLTNSPLQQAFVFGVATNGITPFEKALFSGAIGDEQTFDIQKENVCDLLGHLRTDLLGQLPSPPPFFLKTRITHIAQAESREVVKAMAASISDCGADCECGCGCS